MNNIRTGEWDEEAVIELMTLNERGPYGQRVVVYKTPADVQPLKVPVNHTGSTPSLPDGVYSAQLHRRQFTSYDHRGTNLHSYSRVDMLMITVHSATYIMVLEEVGVN